MNEEIPLTKIRGIGESRAKILTYSGYNTILSVAIADSTELAKLLSVTSNKAERIIDEAKHLLERETIEESAKIEPIQVETVEQEPVTKSFATDKISIPIEKEEWWRSKNGYQENGKEFYALQDRMIVDIPPLGSVEARIVRASFYRSGHGIFILLLCSNRTISTSDRGDVIQGYWHVMAWELGEKKPHHIYTPKYYDANRHRTAQEAGDVINGVELRNAEQRFWEEAKSWIV